MLELLKQYSGAIAKAIDGTYWKLANPADRSTIDEIMPIRFYASSKILLLKLQNSRPTVAFTIAPEQEIPQSRRRFALNEALLQKAKLGKKYIFTEADFDLEAEITAIARYDPDTANSLARYFLEVAADFVPAFNDKAALLAARSMAGLTAAYVDPVTGLSWAIDYPDTIPALLPAPLAGAALWTAPTTAEGLADLRSHALAWYGEFGKFPDYLLMRRDNFLQLAAQESTAREFVRSNGSLTSSGSDLTNFVIDDAALERLISSRLGGTQVKILDASVSVESADGTIADVPLIPDNTYIFCDRNNIERAFVPCWEKVRRVPSNVPYSLESLGTDLAPPTTPIYIGARVVDDAPRVERIAGVANVIPAIFDSRKIAARRVA